MDALTHASGFELYRLRAAIDRELDDPKRILDIRKLLRIGQRIDYFDPRENRACPGIILELRPKTVLIARVDVKQQWILHYASINLNGADTAIQEKVSQGLSRQAVAVGDIVGFHDREHQQRHGVVVRLNDKTVTLIADNQRWRVAYALLHRIVEGDATTIQGEVIQKR